MDALFDLTSEKEHRFHKSSYPCDIIRISASSSKQESYESSTSTETELLSKLKGHAPSTPPEDRQAASLTLVSVHFDDNADITVSKPVFNNLLAHFKIEPYLHYLLSRNCYGFRHLRASTTSTHTFFLGTVIYTLIWSFDPITAATRAIILVRKRSHFGRSKSALRGFTGLLHRHKAHIHHPALLAFLASVHIIHFVDRDIFDLLQVIRQIEKVTGHGPWVNEDPAKHQVSPKQILDWSGEVGTNLVNIANDTRQIEIVGSLLDFLKQEASREEKFPDKVRRRLKETDEVFKAAVPLLRDQVEAERQYMRYLQERNKSQSSVLFALLTHRDATASIELANASQQLAKATQRDSSAMKTIAIMTMLFLPATFFAALFAVPSLQWDQAEVVQKKFWVYWAFTLPTTVLIFLVWVVIVNRRVIGQTLGMTMASRSKDHEAYEA